MRATPEPKTKYCPYDGERLEFEGDRPVRCPTCGNRYGYRREGIALLGDG